MSWPDYAVAAFVAAVLGFYAGLLAGIAWAVRCVLLADRLPVTSTKDHAP